MNQTGFVKFLGITILAVALGFTASVVSAEKAMDPAVMKRWMEYSTPAEHHVVLAPLVGSWNYMSTSWEAPGAEGSVSTGTAETKWIFGGRFIEQNVKGMWMGQVFEGRDITGYDNQKKQYVSVWYDNMGTGMAMSDSGSYDAKTKTLTQTGMCSCPKTGGDRPFRWETQIIDNDNYTFRVYMKEGRKEFVAMEIAYKRK